MKAAIFHPPGYLKLLVLCVLLAVAAWHWGPASPNGAVRASELADPGQPFYYVSPRPGSEFAPSESTIALRSHTIDPAELLDAGRFEVQGTSSGRHNGRVLLATDGQTVIFSPYTPFVNGETVQVTITGALQDGVAGSGNQYSFRFAVSDPLQPLDATMWRPSQSTFQGTQTNTVDYFDFVTAPSDFPKVTVQRWPGQLGDGYIFVSLYDYNHVAQPGYTMILDNNGEPVYFFQPQSLPVSLDFKKQPNGLLTYFLPGSTGGRFFALNDRYEIVDEYAAGNGYHTDNHDLQLLDNGNALLLVHDGHAIDRGEFLPGSSGPVLVTGCTIQELDSNKNVVFQWSSWDHRDEIEITDTNQPLTSNPLGYIHCNSVEVDYDGNLLISSRHLDEITKISRSTGEIIWRMGGKKNEFTFLNDYGFSYQHDARRLSNGILTIYDNGNKHRPLQHSRGINYMVDEVAKTVEKVAEFRNDPDTYALAMGNHQVLPNGNAVIGWGYSSEPFLTEFDSAGSKLLELSSEFPIGTYRAFRFPWRGDPPWPPVMEARLNGDTASLYTSWNGATEVAAYRMLASTSGSSAFQLATVSRDGFETTYDYDLPSHGEWNFWAAAVDQAGNVIGTSNIANINHFANKTYLASVMGK